VLAIVGESGSGKSVSMLAVMGLLPWTATVTADRMTFNGRDLLKISPADRRKIIGKDVAMIFQEPVASLNPCFTVGFQIEEVLRFHMGMDKAQRRARAIELFKQVGIPDPADRLNSFPHQMSGGQCQRVMIAMAIACNPKLLIADEPTTALDVTIQKQILDLLVSLQAKYGMGLIMITHNMGVVAETADRVIVQYKGRKMEEADVLSLFESPKSNYTRALLSALPENAVGDRLPTVTDRIITLIDPATSGELFIDGNKVDIARDGLTKEMRRKVQIVFQNPYGSLNPRQKIGDVLGEPLLINTDKPAEERRDLAMKMLKKVGLGPEHYNRYPHMFSGGQRQRIAIARAMILKPKVVVLDEPTSALDRSVQKQIVELLRKLQADHELSYLFISHDLAVVRAMADYIIVMKQGKIVEEGPTQEIFDNPREAYTQTLMNAAIDSTRFRVSA
ncbi:MAG: ABC transporter ATP-binding protein, partial [Mesorhizobium sp.]